MVIGRQATLVHVTAFGDANKTYVSGLPDAQGNFSGFYDTASDQLYTNPAVDGVARKVYLYPTRSITTTYWSGTAFFDFSISDGVGDAVKVSGSCNSAASDFIRVGGPRADGCRQVRTPSGRGLLVVDDFAIDVLNLIAEAAAYERRLCQPHTSQAQVLRTCTFTRGRRRGPDPLTGRILDAAFTQVDDDLPDEFEDGLPKAEADQETTSSPGSQTDTDGRPTK